MATPPTYVDDFWTAFNSITSPKTVSATATSGDLLVSSGVSSDDESPLNTPTGSSFTSVENTAAVDFCAMRMATAIATGNYTHSQAKTSGTVSLFGGGVWVWRNSVGADDTALGTQASGNAPSLDVVTTVDDCGISVAVGDWNAIDGTTRTWRTIDGSAITEDLYFRDASQYTVYQGHHPDVGVAGTKTVGLTTPSSMKPTVGAVAVQGLGNFPNIEGSAESSTNTAGTSHVVTLPSSIVASDLVLLLGSIGSTAATLNALTDWAESLDESAAIGLKVLRYTGTGVPSNPTFTSSAATRSAWIAHRISNADKAIPPQLGTTATGTSSSPNPPASATPSGGVKDHLIIAFAGMAGEEADDDTWANTPPANYTPNPPLQKSCGTAGTNLGGLICAASRKLRTGSAEDPGQFLVDVSAAWRAQTIIIHPITAAPPLANSGWGRSWQ